MLTNKRLLELARTVADLQPGQERTFAEAVAGIRAERARLAEERRAELGSMSDEDVVELMFMRHHYNWPNPDALTLLREAGFVRGAVIEKAYREGYERGAFDAHTGPGERPTLSNEDDPDYVTMRGYDLADLMKGADHVGA